MEDAPETALTEEQERAVEIEKNRSAFLSGANWFFWIAGLSLINSIIALFCLFTGYSATRKLRAMQAPAEPSLSAEPITP